MSVTTISTIDPSASPNGLVVTSVGVDYAEVRWNAPDSTDHNGIIRFYILIFMEQETAMNFTLTSTSTRLIITTLHPFYTYNVTIAAVTISPGPFSEHLMFMTLEDGKFHARYHFASIMHVNIFYSTKWFPLQY